MISTMFKTSDNLGINCKVDYDSEASLYIVIVSYKDTILTKSVKAMYEPRFGIDISDNANIMEIADNFAIEIEQKYGLQNPSA